MSLKSNSMRFRINSLSKIAAVCLPIVAVVACGDAATEPNANIVGAWDYTVTNLSSGSVTCNVTGTIMHLSQSGLTFAGSYFGGTLTCSPASVLSPAQSRIFVEGAIRSGTVSGNSVSFDVDSPDWQNTGTVSGTSISGTTVMRLVNGSSTYILKGMFSATKR